MPNGMMKPDQFRELKDESEKTNIIYDAVYELYKKRRWNDLKIVGGGFMGGFTAIAAKMAIWK